MSKMRIVMFGLALGSAAIAGILAKGVIGKKAKVETQIVTKIETVDVLVAGTDVQVGEKLGPGTITWKSWPEANVLDVMITRDEMPSP